MTAEDPIHRERDQRIAELEGHIARRNPIGVALPVALVGIGVVAALLAMRARNIAYFFASRTPVTIGAEGEYHFELLRSNVYAQVHGIPTVRGVYTSENGKPFVMVGLRDTPLVVHRRPLAGEKWVPGLEPRQPSQSRFGVRGRLLQQGDVPQYQESLQKILAMGEVQPRDGRLWVLLEGERPGDDLPGFLSFLALSAFGLLNAWFLWRNLSHRLRARRQA